MDSGISVTAVTTPALFTGPPGAPAQVVRVRIRRDRPAGPLYASVHGAGLTTPHPRVLRAQRRAPDSTVEVAVRTGAAAPGELLSATARVATPDGRPRAELPFALTVAEPGWTVRLVPHFHYDPMWWNTQAAYTALWDTPLRPGEAERGWEYEGVPRLHPAPAPPPAGARGPGVPLRALRGRLPQAVLGHPPRRPGRTARADRRGPRRDCRRRLQRAVHQPRLGRAPSAAPSTASPCTAAPWAPTRAPPGSSTSSATTRPSPP